MHQTAEATPDNRSDDLIGQVREWAWAEDLTSQLRGTIPTALPLASLPSYQPCFDAIARALHRRRDHGAALVGEAGSGLDAILFEFARTASRCPEYGLFQKRFVLVDLQSVPAESATKALHQILSLNVARSDVVLCLAGCGAALVGAAAGSIRAQVLRYVAACSGRLILLLSNLEFEGLSQSMRTCPITRVTAPELDFSAAQLLVSHYAASLGSQFGFSIGDDAVRESISLSTRFLAELRLPGRAIEVLRRACENVAYEVLRDRTVRAISAGDVELAVAELSQIPLTTIRGDGDAADYQSMLATQVVGQEHAVQELARELRWISSGFADRSKPASVVLFVGQTGTGKTELAKALAAIYAPHKRIRAYAMGNFVEAHSVSGLIGVPAGYVGHERGGPLVNDMAAEPRNVYLFDEFDKAHSDVVQPLLNAFDEGWIADQRGVRASASDAVFVLTTNLGHRVISDMQRQGKSIEEITARIREILPQMRHGKAARPTFTPEMLSRIRRIIVFKPLDLTAMTGIARKLIEARRRDWRAYRGKDLIVEESVLTEIGREAEQLNLQAKGAAGGRAVHRVIVDRFDSVLLAGLVDRKREYQEAQAVRVGLAESDASNAVSDALFQIEFLSSTAGVVKQ